MKKIDTLKNNDYTIFNNDKVYKYDGKFWISKNYDMKKKNYFQWILKRFFDIFASFIGLIFISPLLLVIAILIKLDSEGPVFFKQKRVGYLGETFSMYKFRTMKVNADKELEKLKALNQTNEGMFKLFNDPRVTKVGKFLRKYSLDELPQLYNVLKGEMSLVGPRPPIVKELETYKPSHFVRFSSLPGITGMWQTSGRS
ncbi:MAG: sugar transferase, partial [Cyanobacteriota bacterium]